MMKSKQGDPLDRHLGMRIKQLRVRKGMSMAKAGEIIEVTPQQISRYESDQHRVTATALYRLARGLGMPVSWFFEGFEEENIAELGRVRNVVNEERGEWNVSNREDRAQELIALWLALPKESQRNQVISLVEAFV